MEEKKSFRLNCDVCDARKLREETFEDCTDITINADVLIVDVNSRRILEKYPVRMNVDTVVEAAGEVDVQIQNGVMELKADQKPEHDTILVVNGALTIAPGTEELLKKYCGIIVNGVVKYPRSLSSCLTRMTVNGKASVYPDDCMLLKPSAIIDAYFPLRAKENGRYFAERRVVFLDGKADVNMLVEKKVQFVTPEFITADGMVKDIIPLLSDETELSVVPDGCVFLNEDVCLNEALLKKNGTKLYINGDLTIEPESTSCILELNYLHVNGTVALLPEQKDAFLSIDAEYKGLKLQKGRLLKNKLKVDVDEALLADAKNGVCLQNCVRVELDAAVTEEQIKNLLQLENCAEVVCTKEQQAAVQLVSSNVGKIITDGGEEQEETKEHGTGVCINADRYVL